MRRGEHGFTYVWLLAVVAVMGIGLAAAGTAWDNAVRREREAELIRVGSAYAQAIASYRRISPGSVLMPPPNLAALMHDDRFIRTYRHLRSLYPDPLNPQRPWGLVTDPSGRVIGVYSQSQQAPLRQAEVVTRDVRLPAASRYADWKFVPKELQ